MKFRTKLMSFILTAAMILGMALPVSAHSFTDVSEYGEAIGALNELGVITGYGPTTFAPNVNVTRWQMTLMLARLLTGNVDSTNTYWNQKTAAFTFTDIDEGSHYPRAIQWAVDEGIIKGVDAEGKRFAPTSGITFAQGMTMAVRALGYPAGVYDVNWPNNYIDKARILGLIEGLENMDMNQTMTRGQTAQLLYNMLDAVKYDGTTISAGLSTGEKLVLVATENKRLNDSYSYARAGRLVFAPLEDDYTLGDAVSMQASLLNISNADDKLGYCYEITSKNYYTEISKCTELDATVTTAAVTVNESAGTMRIGNTTYTVAKRNTSSSSARYPNLIVYGMGSAYNYNTVLTASDIAGTTAYYKLIGFDDDGDMTYERALWVPYVFGQYTTDSQGRISIAGNNAASAVTITGNVKPTAGDYVIYNWDSQTKTLDIYKKLSTATGTLTAVSGGTARIGNTTYTIGNSELIGAEASGMSSLANYINSNITYVADGGYLLAVTTTGTTTTTGTDPLAGSTVCIVKSITSTGVELGMITGTDGAVLYHNQISTVDGVAYSYQTGLGSLTGFGTVTTTQLAVGDVVYYVQATNGTYGLNHVGGPTFVTAGNTTLSYTNGYLTISSSASSQGGTEGSSARQLVYSADASTPIYYYSGYTAGTLNSAGGVEKSTLNNLNFTVGTGYAIFVTYSSGTTGLSGIKAATMVIIVPYSATNMTLTPSYTTGTTTGSGTGTGTTGGLNQSTVTGDFDTVVYIGNPTVTQTSSGVYSIGGAYTLDGQSIALTYAYSGYFAPSFTAGYYAVKGSTLASATPLTASNTVNTAGTVQFMQGATVSGITTYSTGFIGSTTTSYAITLNGQTALWNTLPTFSARFGSMITPWHSAFVVDCGLNYTADILYANGSYIFVLQNPQNPFNSQIGTN